MSRNIQDSNLDTQTVRGFGDEWSRFTQRELSEIARKQIFEDYFSLFDWDSLPQGALGADIGCGSGRWAMQVAPKIGHLILIDASIDAIEVAKSNLNNCTNVSFINASVGSLPIDDNSLDFAYSLGVLHHVPETEEALKSVAAKMKKGAPFLVYLYYAFDNRGPVYRILWKSSDLIRRIVSKLPHPMRYIVSQIIAALVYWPLARMARLLDFFGALPSSWPLEYYHDKPFYVMRTDALDRFGTSLEQRFTRNQIKTMLLNAGFENIRFSDQAPYWCATCVKD
ncbi:class I SAM-dependent methyltransferase [Thalassospiraceae bacterium SW-3-3]|nr:class I SAM-dependent methyltransferase [Thalassospiraceae bacterium SW-3-3]